MADISNTNTKITKTQFIDMKNRVTQYRKKHQKNPTSVGVTKNSTDYVTWNKYLEMNTRWMNHYQDKGVFPGYVYTTPPTPAPPTPPSPSPSEPVYATPPMQYDHQDTGYTCGASTLKMILSSYGITTDEMKLAQKAGTRPVVGTDPHQIDRVLKEYIPSVKVSHHYYSTLGLEGLKKEIKDGGRVITLYQTGTLPGWRGDYGHYSPLQELKDDSVLILCPTKGRVWYRWDVFVAAMKRHPGMSIILVK